MTSSNVGYKVGRSMALENRASPQRSVLLHGFVERSLGDLNQVAVVVATLPNDELVSRVEIGKAGYYNLFLPPGSFRLSVYMDRDGDGYADPGELAGQSKELVTIVPESQVIHTGVDLETWPIAEPRPADAAAVLKDSLALDSEGPLLGDAHSLMAPVFGQANVQRGMYESTTNFFNRVAPIQHLGEVDLTTEKPLLVLVHGISDSPQIFDDLEREVAQSKYQVLFYYYPTGARVAATSQLLYHLFFSGQVLPTARHSVLVAHSMGGLVARGSLNSIDDRAGQSRVDLYASLVTPYGGVAAADFGIKTGPVIVPSWLDVASDSRYLKQLYQPLPPHTAFSMIFADGKANGDGVIALSSQQFPAAREQASKEAIYPDTHVGVMSDREALSRVLLWADERLAAANAGQDARPSLELAADEVAPGELEKRARAEQLFARLAQAAHRQRLRLYYSRVTPTVMRLRAVRDDVSAILQVSVGVGVRVDRPEVRAPILVVPWPEEQGIDGLCDELVELFAEHLDSGDAPAIPAGIPAELAAESTAGAMTVIARRLVKRPPPPVVLGTGTVLSYNPLPYALPLLVMQVPWRADGYFGYWGSGVELRIPATMTLPSTQDVEFLYQPYLFAAGLRYRMGPNASRFTGALGLNVGFEFGNLRLLDKGTGRFYRDSEVRERQWHYTGLAYGSVSGGVRIFNDFYGMLFFQAGSRFKEQHMNLNGQQLLAVPYFFASTSLGVEVRIP